MKKEIQPIVESFNVDEEFMYNKSYLFIKGYATGKELKYTLKALPLARKIHNGQYFEFLVVYDNDTIVGFMNLYAHSKHIISCGPTIKDCFQTSFHQSNN